MQLFPLLSLALSLAYSQAVLGSSSDSYVRFPVQKLANVPGMGSQDVSNVFKRDDVLNSTLINAVGMYVVKVEIGTPPQTAYLQLDTGDVYKRQIFACRSVQQRRRIPTVHR